ncbi:MAG: hypothetical protein EPO26_17325 [Chloroflexota bacterium]|nr:MAG: hypothetical protein EPO26_17325 [Chloroflexota bacterium]
MTPPITSERGQGQAATAGTIPRMFASGPAARLAQAFFAIPLAAKIVFANAAIGTGCVVAFLWLLDRSPQLPLAVSYAWTGIIAAIALGTAIAVNAVVVRSALAPLRELERVAASVERGDHEARSTLGLVRDPQTERISALTNRILNAHDAQRREIEAAARQLRDLSAREIQAREDERRVVAAELREEIGQVFTALSVGLHSIRTLLDSADLDLAAARTRASGLVDLIRGAQELVLRRAQGLRPSALDDLGLVPALRSASLRWSTTLGLPVSFEAIEMPGRGTSPAGITLYRVTEEAVANAAHHSGASRIDVTLRRAGDTLELTVTDDGKGFDVERAEAGRSLGLAGMRQRLSLAGGELRIISRPGNGTRLVARVLDAAEAE